MKVCFFLGWFPALSETFILNQVVGLLQRGHDVEIVAPLPDAKVKQHADVDRWKLIQRTRCQGIVPRPWGARAISGATRLAHWGWRYPLAALDSLNFCRYGRRALNLTVLHERFPAKFERRDFDVIHCHYGPNGQRAVAWRRIGALRGPIVTTFHGFDANLLPKLHGSDMYLELFYKGELFTVGSEFMRRQLLGLGAPRDKMIKLPMGVDLAHFQFCAHRRLSSEFRLLTVARLIDVKGIEYALHAVALIRADLPHLRYIISGDGPLRPMLQDLARSLALDDIVTFRGAVSREEVDADLAAAHIAVLPAVVAANGEEEGQSLFVAEAQACGIPVVATNAGGVPEGLRNGESGLLVPPRDANALASAIITLAKDRAMRERMGQAGRVFVEAYFDLEKQNDRLLEIYRSLQPTAAACAHSQTNR
jgi:colanic acid/amylovoran biosynthesis glycosyltransferase